MQKEKKYLSIPQMIGYGAGDLGSNAFNQFITSFALLYCTDYVGLNAGIVGTLILISKLLDGITDVIFGKMIDNTHTKMGKARPWMFGSSFLLAILEILMFAIPVRFSLNLQYAYFFVIYTAANAIAYTANNISYASLTALITRNQSERVALGSFRYIFATIGAVSVASLSIVLVNAFGGGLEGWRYTAMIMAGVQVVFCMIAVFSVKELPEESKTETQRPKTKKISLFETLRLLFTNKYYLLTLAIYIMMLLAYAAPSTACVFYCKYILGSEEYVGVFSLVGMLLIAGLVINPFVVKKLGLYKVNVFSYIIVLALSIIMIPFGFKGMFGIMITLVAIRYVFQGPLEGSINTIIAEVATYTKYKTGHSIEGSLYSCSSIGIKLGSGLGTALCGWLLQVGGYVNGAAEQTSGALNMINSLMFVIPAITAAVMLLCLIKLDVSKKNQELMDN